MSSLYILEIRPLSEVSLANMRKGNPSALLVGMQTGEATVENSMEFPHKTKNGTAFLPSNSTAGIISYEH